MTIPSVDDIGRLLTFRHNGLEWEFRDALAHRLRELGWRVGTEFRIVPPELIERLDRAAFSAYHADIGARLDETQLLVECKTANLAGGLGQVLAYRAGWKRFHPGDTEPVAVLAGPLRIWNVCVSLAAHEAGVVCWPLETMGSRRTAIQHPSVNLNPTPAL